MSSMPLNESEVSWGYDDSLLGAEVLGLDLEADSLFRYKERICLIQVAGNEQVTLVDPLEGEISDFIEAVLGREVWLHGADYDMALMKREWGRLPTRIWDTQIAARLVGQERFGYAALVLEYFGVDLPKGAQKADWGQRPLPPKMASYALNDVRYLIPLAQKLLVELEDLGRLAWFEESCDWERRRALERKESREENWRIKGSGKFSPICLHYLKAFWHWREAEAESWDRPSFMVANNKDLLEWSQQAAEGRRPGSQRTMRGDRKRRLLESWEAARQVSEEEFPQKLRQKPRVKVANQEKDLDRLLALRRELAVKLGLEAPVIASRAALEGVVYREEGRGLMGWQKDLLGL